jgi:peptidoglycan/xylan/chitin deacetylase (PgdA/CDA1 family)
MSRSRGIAKIKNTVICMESDMLKSLPTGAILMYHRVRNQVYDPWRLSVSPQHFEEHMALLARERVVPLTELLATPGAISITFDDGYLDNLETALPILQKYKLPATVFVATNALRGMEFWWDRVEHSLLIDSERQGSCFGIRGLSIYRRTRAAAMGARLRSQHPRTLEKLIEGLEEIPSATKPACERHRMLSDSDLRTLAASPLIHIGAHTLSHPCLPQLPEREQEEEVEQSQEILSRKIGQPIRTFAYPYGAYDNTSVRVVKRAGFELACVVGGGLVRSNSDPFRLPRLMVRDLGGSLFSRYLNLWKALRWLA